MNFINFPNVEAIGWTLIHSIWQGVGIALITESILCFWRPRSSVRCSIYLTSIAALLLVMCATYAQTASHERSTQLTSISNIGFLTAVRSGKSSNSIATSASPAMPVSIAVVWLAGALAMAAWHGCGLIAVNRLRRTSTPSTSTTLLNCASSLQKRFRIGHNVELWLTDRVRSPIVIGCFKSAIYFPPVALTGLSIQHLEAIIAHELAHVRRHDYAINLLQVFVETFLYYNPSIWWLSHRCRIEREMLVMKWRRKRSTIEIATRGRFSRSNNC